MPEFEDTHEGRNAAQRGKSEDRIGEIVKRAVQDGIREELPRQFELIGLDVSSRETRGEILDDFRWLRRTRVSRKDYSREFSKAIITILVSAIGGSLLPIAWFVMHSTQSPGLH